MSDTETARDFMEALPHARELGLRLVQMGDGRAEIEMPYDTRSSAIPKRA